MRKSGLTYYAVLLVAAVLVSSCSKRVRPTSVEAKDPVRHYFPILQGQTLDLIFPVTTTGDNPLVLHEIQTSCGCIIADRKSRIIVPPGRTQHIRLTYNSNKNVGAVDHTIWVYGNILPAGVLKLRVDVNVVPDAAYTRDYEELYREYNIRNGIVKELVDGKESEQGYYIDGSYEDARQ